MKTPTVFISYAHESEEHKAWVLKLAQDLLAHGIETIFDHWDLAPGADMSLFMQKGITEADRVLMICTENYVRKSEGGLGGVGYERLIVTAEVVDSIETKKFIPIIRNNNTGQKVPVFLGPRKYIDFNDESQYSNRCDELFRELHGTPAIPKPQIGKNPYSGDAPNATEPARNPSPTGVTSAGIPLLDESWFAGSEQAAKSGLAKVGIHGSMELRFGLHHVINKSQIDLLNSVRKSSIKTFGWPIGVLLENRDEYKPRPDSHGIKAEIAVDDPDRPRKSYDYWAIRANGDFYLLQSLFEDQRRENELFFNTRIVRVTESLLFASNLYTNLGVPPETRISVRVAHDGLAGRKLTASSSNRNIIPSVSHESESKIETVITLGAIRDELVQYTQQLTEPLFMLFDFQTFEEPVYTDIVRRFEKGEVS